ncbi:MAG TPA: RNA polymerase sigma factor [Bacillota bacterium]|nr:RNA polymerase sigma factor [Bacillota bacterium]
MISSREVTLIKKVKKGNEKAFKQLYDMYASYALRTAYAMAKNKADASDIVQETFIRIYRSIHTFDHKKSFKPWFYRILMNEANRLLKKRSTESSKVASEEVTGIIEDFTTEKPPRGKILDALDALSEEERKMIVLKYVDRFTEKELAEMLDVNVNTLKSRLLRARKRMKESYAGGGQDDS